MLLALMEDWFNAVHAVINGDNSQLTRKLKKKKRSLRSNQLPRKYKALLKQLKEKLKKKTGPDLYSPEYLAKKHGIKIDSKPVLQNKIAKDKTKISFGFYSFIIISTVIAISVLRLLYFTQDIIIEKLPISKIYINYLFESIRNIKYIIQNFLSNY